MPVSAQPRMPGATTRKYPSARGKKKATAKSLKKKLLSTRKTARKTPLKAIVEQRGDENEDARDGAATPPARDAFEEEVTEMLRFLSQDDASLVASLAAVISEEASLTSILSDGRAGFAVLADAEAAPSNAGDVSSIATSMANISDFVVGQGKALSTAMNDASEVVSGLAKQLVDTATKITVPQPRETVPDQEKIVLEASLEEESTKAKEPEPEVQSESDPSEMDEASRIATNETLKEWVEENGSISPSLAIFSEKQPRETGMAERGCIHLQWPSFGDSEPETKEVASSSTKKQHQETKTVERGCIHFQWPSLGGNAAETKEAASLTSMEGTHKEDALLEEQHEEISPSTKELIEVTGRKDRMEKVAGQLLDRATLETSTNKKAVMEELARQLLHRAGQLLEQQDLSLETSALEAKDVSSVFTHLVALFSTPECTCGKKFLEHNADDKDDDASAIPHLAASITASNSLSDESCSIQNSWSTAPSSMGWMSAISHDTECTSASVARSNTLSDESCSIRDSWSNAGSAANLLGRSTSWRSNLSHKTECTAEPVAKSNSLSDESCSIRSSWTDGSLSWKSALSHESEYTDVTAESERTTESTIASITSSLSRVSAGQVVSAKESAIGGPKYYIAALTEKGRAKVVHEAAPSAEGGFENAQETGFEVLEYELARSTKKREEKAARGWFGR